MFNGIWSSYFFFIFYEIIVVSTKHPAIGVAINFVKIYLILFFAWDWKVKRPKLKKPKKNNPYCKKKSTLSFFAKFYFGVLSNFLFVPFRLEIKSFSPRFILFSSWFLAWNMIESRWKMVKGRESYWLDKILTMKKKNWMSMGSI